MDTRCSISSIDSQNTRSESDLIRAAMQGDPGAICCLVKNYQEGIFTLAYHLAPPEGDPVVIAQTAIQSLIRELPGYRGEVFRIWMYKQLVKVCREAWRSKKANTSGTRLWHKIDTKSSHIKPSPTGMLAGSKCDHYGAQEVIMDRLQDLPLELRLVVVLVDIEGLNYEMTAAVLGLRKREIRGRLGISRRYLCQPQMHDPRSFDKGIK